jgi:hypothetical protein
VWAERVGKIVGREMLVSFDNSVILLLEEYNLDKEDLSNYRLISHLSFLSKLTERVVKYRLTQLVSERATVDVKTRSKLSNCRTVDNALKIQQLNVYRNTRFNFR